MAENPTDIAVAGCHDALRESVRRLALEFEQRVAAAPHDQAKRACHDEFQVGLRRTIDTHSAAVTLITATLGSEKKSDKSEKKKKKKKKKKA